MAKQPVRAASNQPALPEIVMGMRYVARQPILDLRGRVHGYELLFRAGPEAAFRGDGDMATRTMLDNAVIFGLERLSGGLPAFVNCTLEALTENLVEVLPPSMTVLEVLETLEPVPKLIGACRKLKDDGYRLALDDFTWATKFAPLVELADYIKVDFTLSSVQERQSLLKRMQGTTVTMIAEKVETLEEFNIACQEGFTLFQGYYFCRPFLLENKKIPSNRISHIEILQLLHSDEIDFRKLTSALKRDTSLTYRLLRLVNSPVYAMRQRVRSIEAALIAVGEDAFRRIAMLAITCELNSDQPMEILRMAFIRGRFCELAAGLCSLNSTEQYLLGMLSLLPVMLHVPMVTLVRELPLSDQVREALQGSANTEGILLRWVENHERGAWAACDAEAQAHGLQQVDLALYYTESVIWAEDALGGTH
jgi:EAL and modified HD-GYP domain-containing signal transduction protein